MTTNNPPTPSLLLSDIMHTVHLHSDPSSSRCLGLLLQQAEASVEGAKINSDLARMKFSFNKINSPFFTASWSHRMGWGEYNTVVDRNNPRFDKETFLKMKESSAPNSSYSASSIFESLMDNLRRTCAGEYTWFE